MFVSEDQFVATFRYLSAPYPPLICPQSVPSVRPGMTDPAHCNCSHV